MAALDFNNLNLSRLSPGLSESCYMRPENEVLRSRLGLTVVGACLSPERRNMGIKDAIENLFQACRHDDEALDALL